MNLLFFIHLPTNWSMTQQKNFGPKKKTEWPQRMWLKLQDVKKISQIPFFSRIKTEEWMGKQVEEIVKSYVACEHLMDIIISVWLSDSGTNLGWWSWIWNTLLWLLSHCWNILSITASCSCGKLLTRPKKSPFSDNSHWSLNYTVRTLTYIFK